MRYLLDTCVVSDVVRGVPAVLRRARELPPDWLAISSITLMEIEYGLLLHPERASRLAPVISALLGQIGLLDFQANDARATAAVRASLRRRGETIGSFDSLIAGSALSRGLILATSNVREFERIEDLQVEDWRGSG
jgi:tRNA(fMet)-specific endonuclease VapC